MNHRRFTEHIIHRWISITAGFIRFFILGLNPHPIFLPHIVICRNTLTLPCRRLCRNLSKSLTWLTAWITADGIRNIILGFNLDLNVKFSFQICLHLYHWLLDKLAMFLFSCNAVVIYFCLFLCLALLFSVVVWCTKFLTCGWWCRRCSRRLLLPLGVSFPHKLHLGIILSYVMRSL